MSNPFDFTGKATELMERYHAAKKRGEIAEAQRLWDESKFFLMLAEEAKEDELAGVER